MNKTELIEAIAARSNSTKAQTTIMLNGLLDVIQENMASGNDVQLVGFGTFSVVKRKARKGRNPRTGAVITIPAWPLKMRGFGWPSPRTADES